MQLPGRLGSTTLGDILGALYRERVSGVLELLENNGARHRIRLDVGLVSDIETEGQSPRLGDVLAIQGVLSAEQRREVERCSLAEFSRPLGSVLLEKRLVTRHELLAALRYQNHARLECLYALKDARVLFRVGRTDTLEHSSLSAEEALAGRPRARDSRRAPAREFRSAPASSDPRRQALGVLGLVGEPERAEIHRAFRRLAAELHPDRAAQASFRERARSMRQFARLSAAYHQLVA